MSKFGSSACFQCSSWLALREVVTRLRAGAAAATAAVATRAAWAAAGTYPSWNAWAEALAANFGVTLQSGPAAAGADRGRPASGDIEGVVSNGNGPSIVRASSAGLSYLPLDLPRGAVCFVDSVGGLAGAAASLSGDSVIGLDTEWRPQGSFGSGDGGGHGHRQGHGRQNPTAGAYNRPFLSST
jgi:hypothetical protein